MLLLEYVCHVYSIAHSLSVCLSVRMLVYFFFFFHLSAFVANKRMYISLRSVYTHGRPCDVPQPFDYTHGPKIIKHATVLFLSFCYAPKRPSPFFLYIPTKNLFQR